MAIPTIVLLPVWGAGHFMPMIEAGKHLLASSSRAMSLTVLLMPSPTAQAASDISEHVRREEASGLDIRFHHLPEVNLPTDHSGTEEFISRVVQLHGPHLRGAIAGLPCPVTALVVDIFCTPALDVTRELAVPAYVYFASGAAMLALLLRSPSLDEEVDVEFEEMRGGVDLPGLPPVPPSSLPDTMLDRQNPTYPWFVYTGRRFIEASGFIVNTVAELESGVLAAIADSKCTRCVRAPAVYPIGPVLTMTQPATAGEDLSLGRWLDSQAPASVLFICFGSKGYLAKPHVDEIARFLERSGHRFLWVLRGHLANALPGQREPTDADLAELLPKGFLEKTKERGLVWPKRAPQKEILAHAAVAGFVTHCGWNSILESLWFGVPMLPWPLAADQHFNAFLLVSDMGVALPLKVDRKRDTFIEAAELERAATSLVMGEEGRKAKKKAVQLMALCRNAVKESGSSRAALRKLSDELLGGVVHLPNNV